MYQKILSRCFAADQLPKIKRRPALLIANTDESSKPGMHWVAFFFPKKGPAEYFDSQGEYPNNTHFLRFLKSNCKSFISSCKSMQGFFSTTCGHFCAVYLFYKSKGKSLRYFLKKFSTDLEQNDEKIEKLYNSIFGNRQQGGNRYFTCNQICKSKKNQINRNK